MKKQKKNESKTNQKYHNATGNLNGKNEKGITMIALIVSIVVMLILARSVD